MIRWILETSEQLRADFQRGDLAGLERAIYVVELMLLVVVVLVALYLRTGTV